MMMEAEMIDQANLTLLAEGAQAEVFHYGDDKVLRVMRSADDKEMLLNEIAVIGELREAGVPVPEAYEYAEVGGRPAVIGEKIQGENLMAYLNPFGAMGIGRALGDMHLRLSHAAPEVTLPLGRDRARHIIGQSELLDDDLMSFVFSLIDGLEEGTDLCHGDFHPGNILRQDDRDFIIDWVGVYRGDILSDAANTYLLIRTIPRPPGLGSVQYAFMRLMGPLLVRGYLGAVRKGHPFDWGIFSRWLVIKAAERTVHGMSGEKERLAAFIGTCYELRKRGVPPEKWYRQL